MTHAHDACPHADAIVARHLDGHDDATHDAAFLADHLRQCRHCATALARARRIDALVATTAPVEVDDATARRWLTHATTVVDPVVPAPVDTRTGRLVRLAAAALLLAAGFALARLVPTSRESGDVVPPQRVATSRSEIEPAPTIEPRDTGDTADEVLQPFEIALPEAGAAPARAPLAISATPDSPTTRMRTVLAADPATLELHGLAAAWLRSEALGLGTRGIRGAGARAAREAREAALHAALAADPTRHDEHFGLICLATSRTTGTDANATAALLRERPAFVRWLSRRIGERADTAIATTAIRVAAPECEAALRRSLLGRAERLDHLVHGLRDVADAGPSTVLLLSLWRDVRRVGIGANTDEFAETAQAQRWFSGLPGDVATSLIAVVENDPNGELRRLAMLALAAAADPRAAEFLAQRLCGSRHEERLLAVYALGALPPNVVRTAMQRVPMRLRDRPLAAAALLRAGDPELRAALHTWNLSDEERDLLRQGRFPLAQLPAVVALCQSRPVTKL